MRRSLNSAREAFGFPSFRPGQEQAIRSILDGHDTLVVQPTGSGKSAIYQVAGLIIPGSTVIISPLIALQKDQMDSIQQSDAPVDAAVVNSTQPAAAMRETLEKIGDGEIEYIFLAPEQLRKEETMEKLLSAKISLFVIDEAHCISEWGHDFRPDYMNIGPAIEKLGHPVVLAMTATASTEVRREIISRLGLRKPRVLVRGFDRPNIFLRVDHFASEEEKLEALVKQVAWSEKPGIVYAGTRKNAEVVRAALEQEGVLAKFYHAGMKPADRRAIQEQFMSGLADVVVATNAFGMGIDKSNVRFVYHFDISESLDSYYQEIGRAGRDGERAEAILYYRAANVGSARFKASEPRLKSDLVERVLNVIAASENPELDLDAISEATSITPRQLTVIIHRLKDVGAIRISKTGPVALREGTQIAQSVDAAVEAQEVHRETKRQRLEKMNGYANTSQCRRQEILQYFGDEFSGPCNFCDNCERESARQTAGEVEGGIRREVA